MYTTAYNERFGIRSYLSLRSQARRAWRTSKRAARNSPETRNPADAR